MANITTSISNELINPSIDLAIEYAELTLDEIFDEGMKEVPFIKTLYTIGKIGLNIKERFFVKKLLTFLKEFHSGDFDQGKLEQFKHEFNSNKQYREKVTEHLMVFTDSFLYVDKAKVLANLFSAYVSGKFDWAHFTNLSTCLDSIHPQAILFLEELSNVDFSIVMDREKQIMPRNGEKEALLYSCGIAYVQSPWASNFKVSQLGIDLFQFGLKPKFP